MAPGPHAGSQRTPGRLSTLNNASIATRESRKGRRPDRRADERARSWLHEAPSDGDGDSEGAGPVASPASCRGHPTARRWPHKGRSSVIEDLGSRRGPSSPSGLAGQLAITLRGLPWPLSLPPSITLNLCRRRMLLTVEWLMPSSLAISRDDRPSLVASITLSALASSRLLTCQWSAPSMVSSLGLEGLGVVTKDSAGLLEMHLESGALVGLVIARALQVDDRVEHVLALAGAAGRNAAAAGMIDKQHGLVRCASAREAIAAWRPRTSASFSRPP